MAAWDQVRCAGRASSRVGSSHATYGETMEEALALVSTTRLRERNRSGRKPLHLGLELMRGCP